MSQPVYTNPGLFHLQKGLLSVTRLALQRAQRADIVLGMPHHDCRFHGICKVEKRLGLPVKALCECGGETVSGWLLRPDPGHCVLLLERGHLPLNRERYHFSRQAVEISRSLDVSSFFVKSGGKKYLLLKGAYPLRLMKDYYLLYLPLSN